MVHEEGGLGNGIAVQGEGAAACEALDVDELGCAGEGWGYGLVERWVEGGVVAGVAVAAEGCVVAPLNAGIAAGGWDGAGSEDDCGGCGGDGCG